MVYQLIIDERTAALDLYQQRALQLFEVMGDKGLGETKFLNDGGDGFLVVANAQDNPQSVLVREAFGKKSNRPEMLIFE